jgi:pyruvate carboxylase subunit B
MILGKMGKLPGELAPEIVALAKEKGLEFYTGNPQDAFPNELGKFRAMMKEEGWDCGQDDEELFELAMHERQYRDYRSGAAKERFNKDLEAAKAKAGIPVQAPVKGQLIWQYDVADDSTAPIAGTVVEAGKPIAYIQTYYGIEPVTAAIDGRIISVNRRQGDMVSKGETLALVR